MASAWIIQARMCVTSALEIASALASGWLLDGWVGLVL